MKSQSDLRSSMFSLFPIATFIGFICEIEVAGWSEEAVNKSYEDVFLST